MYVPSRLFSQQPCVRLACPVALITRQPNLSSHPEPYHVQISVTRPSPWYLGSRSLTRCTSRITASAVLPAAGESSADLLDSRFSRRLTCLHLVQGNCLTGSTWELPTNPSTRACGSNAIRPLGGRRFRHIQSSDLGFCFRSCPLGKTSRQTFCARWRCGTPADPLFALLAFQWL